MKLAIASRHNPRPEGTPTGRVFWALGEGLVALGHDVEAVAWAHDQPHDDLPAWCSWRALPRESELRIRARALVRPRHDPVVIDWEPAADAIALAEDPLSFPLVRNAERTAVVFHYLTKLDAPAVGRVAAKDVQDRRHERYVARKANAVLAFSDRVGSDISRRSVTVPIAYPVPEAPLPVTSEPVAVMFANWEWPPNAPALRLLLDIWPDVRERVPGARLRLAGWGLEHMQVGIVPGVELVGAVPKAVDALEGAAVLAFPCPPSSGPKVKVMEALSYGVPVVTTTAGAEGLVAEHGRDVVVSDEAGFADALVATLGDDARRGALAVGGRQAMLAHHAPEPAARRRVEVLEAAFGRP
ncbi:MAG TPA: glycosyltransferase family 4 protein [Acidimicrobiales bacterium]|nr:glycosyltransferase family 4 protein [Acidimicrobiales bacterium]